jgi:hypothetical protein
MPCAKLSRYLVPLAVALSVAGPDRTAGAQSLSTPGRQAGELERVQMHRNSLRGVHYLSTWRPDNVTQPEQFTLRATRDIDLDGDPQVNVRGNVYPIDGNGDGQFGLLHFNGYRVMRVYGPRGQKAWEVNNPAGKVHRSASHRFTLAVFNADGERGQEIVHCWADPGASTKSLVLRDGQTGKVLKKVQLVGQAAGEECHVAAFRVAGRSKPLILVAGKAPDSACRTGNWTPYFAKTYAFDAGLARLWERTTCAAGHYAWPLDATGDGLAEAVFVGKYLLRPDGTTRCVLQGLGTDHVDSMVVANLDPDRTGVEALAVGTTGTRLFSASTCTLRWTIPNSVINNPQQTGAAYLRDEPGLAANLLVTTKLNRDGFDPELMPLRAYTVSPQGQVVGRYTQDVDRFTAPLQNANLDGAPGAEDRLTAFGQVVDQEGRLRLSTAWYWNRQALIAAERDLGVADQWARSPFAFDLNNDGRDELIVWGRRKLIVGTRG